MDHQIIFSIFRINEKYQNYLFFIDSVFSMKPFWTHVEGVGAKLYDDTFLSARWTNFTHFCGLSNMMLLVPHHITLAYHSRRNDYLTRKKSKMHTYRFYAWWDMKKCVGPLWAVSFKNMEPAKTKIKFMNSIKWIATWEHLYLFWYDISKIWSFLIEEESICIQYNSIKWENNSNRISISVHVKMRLRVIDTNNSMREIINDV